MPKIINIATGPVDPKEFTRTLGYASAALYSYINMGLVLNPDGSVNPKEVYEWSVANNKRQLEKRVLRCYQVHSEDSVPEKKNILPVSVKLVRCVDNYDGKFPLTVGKDYVVLNESKTGFFVENDLGSIIGYGTHLFAILEKFVSDDSVVPENRATAVPHEDSFFTPEFFPKDSTAAPIQIKKDYLSKMNTLFVDFMRNAEALKKEYLAAIEKGVDD